MTTAVLNRPKPFDKSGPVANGAPTTGSARRLTPEEYLARERENQFKSEYFDGEMIAMPGASWNHTTIKDNLAAELRAAFRGTVYKARTGDVRIWIPATGSYFYPDVLVVDGAPQFKEGTNENLTNPVAVVEVLSPSTGRFDRGAKFDHYKTVDSLREYFLVHQDKASIERYTRQADGNWTKASFEDLEGALDFSSIPVSVAMGQIYSDVEFGEASPTDDSAGQD